MYSSPREFAEEPGQMAHEETPLAGVAAVIPARGGSQGVKRKNARPLCGKPLVAYSIEAALKTPDINYVVVSSEDPEILEIAASYEGVLALKRPGALSTDSASLVDVIAHADASLEKAHCRPRTIAVMLPTSPFRNPRLLRTLLQPIAAGHCEVMTARNMATAHTFYCHVGSSSSQRVTKVRQGARLFRPYGVFAAFNKVSHLPTYMHVIDNQVEMIDIDYPHQFKLAEEVIRAGLYDFDQE